MATDSTIQIDGKALENELVQALKSAGIIPENFGDPLSPDHLEVRELVASGGGRSRYYQWLALKTGHYSKRPTEPARYGLIASLRIDALQLLNEKLGIPQVDTADGIPWDSIVRHSKYTPHLNEAYNAIVVDGLPLDGPLMGAQALCNPERKKCFDRLTDLEEKKYSESKNYGRLMASRKAIELYVNWLADMHRTVAAVVAPFLLSRPWSDSGDKILVTPGKCPFDFGDWSEVRMRFVNGHALVLWGPEETITLGYDLMDAVDGRTGKPNQAWEDLRRLSKSWPELHMDDMQRNQKDDKQRKHRLSKWLKDFFRIDSEPFERVTTKVSGFQDPRRGTTYKVLFRVEPEA